MKETSTEKMAAKHKAQEMEQKKKFQHNWRTDMLAIPKDHKEEMHLFQLTPAEKTRYMQQKKQDEQEKKLQTEVRKVHREGEISKRLQDLGLSPIRVYITQKQMFKNTVGQKFVKTMEKLLKKTKESRYHEYDRARAKLKRDKAAKKVKRKGSKAGKKGHKLSAKASKAQGSSRIAELAKPHVPPKPPKINRGKRGKIEQLQSKMARLAAPMHYTPKYYVDPIAWKEHHVVSINALHYRPSERVYELARPVSRPPQEVKIPGAVDPSALTGIPPKRVFELCVPTPRRTAIEVDIKEDAFKVSPTALKYKATPRILELAKPIERD